MIFWERRAIGPPFFFLKEEISACRFGLFCGQSPRGLWVVGRQPARGVKKIFALLLAFAL
jgi:hypothetical protein